MARPGTWADACNRIGEIEGGREWLRVTPCHDGSGDFPGARFLAIEAEDASEFLDAPGIYDIRRGFCDGWPHAHVERALAHE